MARPLDEQTGTTINYAWEQHVKRSGADMGGSSRIGDARLTEKIFFPWVAWAGETSLEGELLGNTIVRNGRLSRVPPWRHPLKPWLVATDISTIEPQKWKSKNKTGSYGPYSDHDRVLLTIVFQAPPAPMLSDEDFQTNYSSGANAGEYSRYTVKEEFPILQVGSRQGSSFVYTEGTVAGAASGVGPVAYKAGVNNQPSEFPGPIPILLPKSTVKVTWFQVPPTFIVDPNTGRALNFYRCLGKVNGATTTTNGTVYQAWWGHAPGTMLLKSWELIKDPSPYLIKGLPTWGPQYYYRVVFTFDCYDPPIDTLAGNSTRGHLTAPWPFSPTGLSYAIKSRPNADGTQAPPYQSADMGTLFSQVTSNSSGGP